MKHVFNNSTHVLLACILSFYTTVSFAKSKDFTLPKQMTVTNLSPQGTGTVKKIGFRIFKGKLWTAKNYSFSKQSAPKPPYALQLKYARAIKAKYIVKASIKEMQAQNIPKKRLNQWKKKLTQIIPSVQKNDVITGVHTQNSTTFYLNEKKIGVITNPRFGYDFFGIWLKENTSEPRLRNNLMRLK